MAGRSVGEDQAVMEEMVEAELPLVRKRKKLVKVERGRTGTRKGGDRNNRAGEGLSRSGCV